MEEACSFCGKKSHEVLKLMPGPTPRVQICDCCIAVCINILEKTRIALTRQLPAPYPGLTPKPNPIRGVQCSFCAKGPGEVWKLMAGPGLYICNSCVDEKKAALDLEFPPPPPPPSYHDLMECSLCNTPRRQTRKLIDGLMPKARICDWCLNLVSRALTEQRRESRVAWPSPSNPLKVSYCSFCAKEVLVEELKFLSGRDVQICDPCIDEKKAALDLEFPI